MVRKALWNQIDFKGRASEDARASLSSFFRNHQDSRRVRSLMNRILCVKLCFPRFIKKKIVCWQVFFQARSQPFFANSYERLPRILIKSMTKFPRCLVSSFLDRFCPNFAAVSLRCYSWCTSSWNKIGKGFCRGVGERHCISLSPIVRASSAPSSPRGFYLLNCPRLSFCCTNQVECLA